MAKDVISDDFCDNDDADQDERTKITYQKATQNCKINSVSLLKSSGGGIKSQRIEYLTHPLDRSIAVAFVLTVFFTLLAVLTGIPIVVALFALLPPTYVIKRLCACNLSSNPNHQPLAPIDSYWLNAGHITHCLLYLDKGLSIEQLRDVVTTRVLVRPELVKFKTRIQRKGFSRTPFWLYNDSSEVIDSFMDHIIEDEPIADKKMLNCRLVQLMSTALPPDKPLWQIRYASYCNQVVLIVRIHQSLCDGIGLVSILLQYLADSPSSTSTIMKPRFGGSTLPINIFRAVIVGPLTFIFWIIWAFTRRHNNYLRQSKNKKCKSIYWTSIDLPKVYRVKQVTRSSLNDVMLSAISGSVRNYLTTKANIINPPDINVSIPIDIRSSNQYDANLVGVNYVLVTSPIPTNTEGSKPVCVRQLVTPE